MNTNNDTSYPSKINCDFCNQEIDGAPFNIVTPEFRAIVCGECMNLFGNQLYDELVERIEKYNTSPTTIINESQVTESDTNDTKNIRDSSKIKEKTEN